MWIHYLKTKIYSWDFLSRHNSYASSSPESKFMHLKRNECCVQQLETFSVYIHELGTIGNNQLKCHGYKDNPQRPFQSPQWYIHLAPKQEKTSLLSTI